MSQVDSMDYDHFLDIKDMCCSAPIIYLTKELKLMQSGDIVLAESNKSSMQKDIPSYCSLTSNELLRQENNDGIFHFWIKVK